MMATRNVYSREFKVETVKLVTEHGRSQAQVAREMGIDIQTLRTWIKQLVIEGNRAFPGQGQPRDAELVRLQRENEQLRHERDILEKALGIFSRMPQ
jgi:transposase